MDRAYNKGDNRLLDTNKKDTADRKWEEEWSNKANKEFFLCAFWIMSDLKLV